MIFSAPISKRKSASEKAKAALDKIKAITIKFIDSLDETGKNEKEQSTAGA